MKWLKRLFLLMVFLAVFAGALALAAWHMAHRPPAWYGRVRAPGQIAAAAQRAEIQLTQTSNWAAAVQNFQAHPALRQTAAAADLPADTQQISLTDDELTGFFQKWDAAFGWSERYRDYLTDPQIILNDGRLILAATVKSLGTVVSVHFEPKLEDGKLRVSVVQVMAGRLPLPQAYWDQYSQKLRGAIEAHLADWQQEASIGADGTANGPAVAAAMSELLLNVLQDKPAEPALFLPYNYAKVHRDGRCLPVRLTAVSIEGTTLNLTVRPLSPLERQQLLEYIRTPRNEHVASSNSATIR